MATINRLTASHIPIVDASGYYIATDVEGALAELFDIYLNQAVKSTSSPTFVNLTLSGDLAVNGGDITSTGNITLDSAGNNVILDNADLQIQGTYDILFKGEGTIVHEADTNHFVETFDGVADTGWMWENDSLRYYVGGSLISILTVNGMEFFKAWAMRNGMWINFYNAAGTSYLQLRHLGTYAHVATAGVTPGPIRILADQDLNDYFYFTTASNIAKFLPSDDSTYIIGESGSVVAEGWFDAIKSDGDIIVTAAGGDFLVDSGLTVGSTTEAGDNNLRVEGTSTLVGNVTTTGRVAIGAAISSLNKLLIDHDVSVTKTDLAVKVDYDNDYTGTASGNMVALDFTADATNIGEKKNGTLIGISAWAEDYAIVPCTGWGVIGIYGDADSSHPSVPCYGVRGDARGSGENIGVRGYASGGTSNWDFYAANGNSRFLNVFIDNGNSIYLRSSDEAEYIQTYHDGTDGHLLTAGTNAGMYHIHPADGTTLGDGGATNYTTFASDGRQTMAGTARYLIGYEIDASGFKEPPAQSATLVNRGIGVAWEFADGNEEHIHAEIRLTGRWQTTEDLCIIILWDSPTISQDCDWEVRYLFRAPDEDMTEANTEGTVTDFLESSSTANGLVHSSELCIPNADFSAGDKVLQLEIWRDGDDVGDTLGASAFLHRIIVRGTADNLGGVVT